MLCSHHDPPYGMFQPMGPNLRRSWTTACRNARPNRRALKGPGWGQLSKKSGELMGSSAYDLQCVHAQEGRVEISR